MSVECGGCQGIGSHKRWCENHVGRAAAFYGRLGERAESLADTIGGNDPGAANHCYQAGAMLKATAERLRGEFQSREALPPTAGDS